MGVVQTRFERRFGMGKYRAESCATSEIHRVPSEDAREPGLVQEVRHEVVLQLLWWNVTLRHHLNARGLLRAKAVHNLQTHCQFSETLLFGEQESQCLRVGQSLWQLLFFEAERRYMRGRKNLHGAPTLNSSLRPSLIRRIKMAAFFQTVIELVSQNKLLLGHMAQLQL